jgi:hypothetical protein
LSRRFRTTADVEGTDTGGCAKKRTRDGRSCTGSKPWDRAKRSSLLACNRPLALGATTTRPRLRGQRPAAPLAIAGWSGFFWNVSWTRAYCRVVTIELGREPATARPPQSCPSQRPRTLRMDRSGLPWHSRRNTATCLSRVAFDGHDEANIGTYFVPKIRAQPPRRVKAGFGRRRSKSSSAAWTSKPNKLGKSP